MTSSPTPSPRARILAAVVDLLRAQDPAQVSITAVVRQAGTTRPTFYRQVGDLPTAFAEAAVTRIDAAFTAAGVGPLGIVSGTSRASVVSPAAQTQHPHDVVAEDLPAMERMITDIIEDLAPDADFFRRVLLGHGGHQVQLGVIEAVAEELRIASPLAPALAQGPLPPAFTAKTLAAGASWAMLDWFADDHRPPAAAIAHRLTTYLHRSVIGGLGGPPAVPTTPDLPTTPEERKTP